MNAESGIRLKKILAPVDFSPASKVGLRLARAVAERFDAKLLIHYAIEPPVYPEWGYAHLTIRDLHLRREAEERLPAFAAECVTDAARISGTFITVGEADLEIVKAAAREQADLVVLASHGSGVVKRALLGSTAERVVRHAPCPVLVAREGKEVGGAFLLRRILVPTDFSALSAKALQYAACFARCFKASLVVLHVVPTTLPGEFSHLGILVQERRIIEAAQERLREFCAAELGPNLDYEARVMNGGPAHVVCSAAADLKADLIAVSTHGHGALRHFLLGSVAERVVRHAPCPVLVVRSEERDFVDTNPLPTAEAK